MLELEFDSKNTETESTLEKKSDFDEDELLQLGREYNQRYANHEKEEALENTEENKTEKAPPEKEESVKRKIIKLNTPSSKFICMLFVRAFRVFLRCFLGFVLLRIFKCFFLLMIGISLIVFTPQLQQLIFVKV